MIVGTNNKIIVIKRVNFKEEVEDVEATTQQLIDQKEEASFHANEETQQNMWYLDTGCSNHMCGEKRKVTIQTKGNSTHTITNVFFVPDLKTNLLNFIKDGVCQIQDAKLGLIAQVNMTENRMFPLYLHNTAHLCFLAKLKDEAWLWHFCYGHLNFGGLKTLQQKNMVMGLPQIIASSQFYEECVVSKQHRNQFPQGKSWRAKRHWSLFILTFVGQ
ncbi:hypothetical protein AAG906_038819 [Vitis piasezkii]